MSTINYFLNAMRSGGNPEQMLIKFLQNQNPQLVEMAKNNDVKGIESFARELCKQQGKDFDKEFSSFLKQLGG